MQREVKSMVDKKGNCNISIKVKEYYQEKNIMILGKEIRKRRKMMKIIMIIEVVVVWMAYN